MTSRQMTTLPRRAVSLLGHFYPRKIMRINKNTRIGYFLILLIVGVFFVSFFWTPYDPSFMALEIRFKAPSFAHPFGTDQFGRDILSRVMIGSHVSVTVALSAVASAFISGTFVGVLTGYLGGKFDLIVTRIVDVLLAIPALVFALGIVAILGPSAKSVAVALGITYSRQFARITRSAVVAVKNKSYIEASVGLGLKVRTIVYKDILPNIFPVIMVQITAAIAWGILDEASLGFLGLGVQPPNTSWGSLLIEGRQFAYQAWWIAFFGGVPVALSVFGINLFGDGLRDLFDPRSTRSYFRKNEGRKNRSRNLLPSTEQISSVNLVEIRNLSVEFLSDAGAVKAIDSVSLSVSSGEILGIVGESASGKSTLALSILGLLPPNGSVMGGQVIFDNKNLLNWSEEEIRDIRGAAMTYVTQDALAAMNPVTKVEEQIEEVLRDHGVKSKKIQAESALDLLKLVKLKEPERSLRSFPHELSGGMQQRVVIAESLALNPKLLIADEPTTALDVSVQAGILQLLRSIREKHGTSIIFITHDLATVAELCDRVAVMYAGSIVETGSVKEIFEFPKHPYTRALLGGLLPLRGKAPEKLNVLKGQPPRTGDWPSGCAFHPRCPLFAELEEPNLCKESKPSQNSSSAPNWAACHFADSGKSVQE